MGEPEGAFEHIAALIAGEGPIPFEKFMSMSLYGPGGYYSSPVLRSTAAGDFLTSPEVSPLFGQVLGAYVRSELARVGEPFQLVEVGAGSGSLLESLLEEVQVSAIAVERSPAARETIALRLPQVEVRTELPGSVRGVILANELVDNLPVALAQRDGEGWRERWVTVTGGRLELIDADPREEVLGWLELHADHVPDGGWVEVQLEARRWAVDCFRRIEAGSMLVFDYGDTTAGLASRRLAGTLRTYRSHHLGPEPLLSPGELDITADVDFSAMAGALAEVGADVEVARQGEFLTGLGLADRLESLKEAEFGAARAGDEALRLAMRDARTGGETLLHPRGLGAFLVLVARRPSAPLPSGG